MKNLELFEIQCAIEWILKEQSGLLAQQDWIDRELHRLDNRRNELEYQKRVLEVMAAETESEEKGYK